jgi:plasmid maintenance system antidote protein VapI
MNLQEIMMALAQQGQGNPNLQDIGDIPRPSNQEVSDLLKSAPSAVVGMPVDIISEAMRPFGYDVPRKDTIGSTEWFGKGLGADTESGAFLTGQFMLPDAMDAVKAVGLLGIPAAKLNKAMAAKDLSPSVTKTGRKKFGDAIDNARSKMEPKDRAQVDAFDVDTFEGKVYLNEEGTHGFAMNDDGYISHLFKDPDDPRPGGMTAALTKARAEGAQNLHAFDTYLSPGYQKRGAVETSRDPWNPEYATDEIMEAFGGTRPDYVGMDIGGVFKEKKFSDALGPRAQEPFSRYTTTPTGRPVARPPTMDKIITPANKKRIRGLVEKGMEKGGEQWYWMGDVLDEYIKVHGPKEGTRLFDEFMDFGAAVSPRANITSQLKRASMLQYLKKQGMDVSTITPQTFPAGYGHLASSGAHRRGIERLAETGAVGDRALAPKTPSYAANMKGNYDPVTVDSHNMQIWSGEARSPSKQEYHYMEQVQKEMAEEMGLDPAEFQSALWVGAKDITGVADPRNLSKAMNVRIAKTAEELGISEKEAMTRFIKGDEYLRAMIGGVGVGMIADAMMGNETQQRMQ